MDFNCLPFAAEKELEIHAISGSYVEFGDEPKLRIHRYGEKNRPVLSYWFAVSSEWFPDGKFVVFDIRKVVGNQDIRLPFRNKLEAVAELVLERFDSQLGFLERVCLSKQEPEPEIGFEKPIQSETTSSSLIASIFYQTGSREEFISVCRNMPAELGWMDAGIVWDGLVEVQKTERRTAEQAFSFPF